MLQRESSTASIISTEGHLHGCDGQSIFYHLWRPAGQPRALLLLAHGLTEHSGRYTGFAQYFAAQGYCVAALDHVGHGLSEGEHGYVEQFDEYIETLELFRQHLMQTLPPVDVFLVGHSMGGLISAAYLLTGQHHLAGCVLSGAALQPVKQPTAMTVTIMHWLSVLLPHLGVLRLEAAAISRDEQVLQTYLKDPLVYRGRLSVRLVVELFDCMERVFQHAEEIRLPLLIMHGEADRLTHPAGSRALYQAVGSADKTLKLYPGLYHEIFNEPERDRVLADVAGWLQLRTPTPTAATPDSTTPDSTTPDSTTPDSTTPS